MEPSVDPVAAVKYSVDQRARLSAGASSTVIHEAVAAALLERAVHGERLLDVGCGAAGLRPFVQALCDRYVGTDVVRHSGFPPDAEFLLANLDAGNVPLPDGSCDVVACVETIEHVENPRALMREMTRLVRPGGWLVVTTPNQLGRIFRFLRPFVKWSARRFFPVIVARYASFAR